MSTLPKGEGWEVYPSPDGYSVRFTDGRDHGQWLTPEAAAEYAEKNA